MFALWTPLIEQHWWLATSYTLPSLQHLQGPVNGPFSGSAQKLKTGICVEMMFTSVVSNFVILQQDCVLVAAWLRPALSVAVAMFCPCLRHWSSVAVLRLFTVMQGQGCVLERMEEVSLSQHFSSKEEYGRRPQHCVFPSPELMQTPGMMLIFVESANATPLAF
jgi:hypothetical protein